MPLHVTLQIYSGRRNPNWRVSGETEARLREALADLKPGPPWKPPSQLGYRGVRIKEHALDHYWLCVRGQVLKQDEAGPHWFSDPECSVEAMALDSGRGVLDEVQLSHLIRMLRTDH